MACYAQENSQDQFLFSCSQNGDLSKVFHIHKAYFKSPSGQSQRERNT